jgi:hypothetical protein
MTFACIVKAQGCPKHCTMRVATQASKWPSEVAYLEHLFHPKQPTKEKKRKKEREVSMTYLEFTLQINIYWDIVWDILLTSGLRVKFLLNPFIHNGWVDIHSERCYIVYVFCVTCLTISLIVLWGLCLRGNKFDQQVDHQCNRTTIQVRMLENILKLVC